MSLTTEMRAANLIPSAPLPGAVFYGRYAGSHRSPKLATFEEATAFDTLLEEGRTVELLGFAAGTADELYCWNSVKSCWDVCPWPLYEVGTHVPVGPREVSRVEFDIFRSAGIEDRG